MKYRDQKHIVIDNFITYVFGGRLGISLGQFKRLCKTAEQMFDIEIKIIDKNEI